MTNDAKKQKPKGWTKEELESAVLCYAKMIEMDQAGEKFNKAGLYKELAKQHPTRSWKSF